MVIRILPVDNISISWRQSMIEWYSGSLPLSLELWIIIIIIKSVVKPMVFSKNTNKNMTITHISKHKLLSTACTVKAIENMKHRLYMRYVRTCSADWSFLVLQMALLITNLCLLSPWLAESCDKCTMKHYTVRVHNPQISCLSSTERISNFLVKCVVFSVGQFFCLNNSKTIESTLWLHST